MFRIRHSYSTSRVNNNTLSKSVYSIYSTQLKFVLRVTLPRGCLQPNTTRPRWGGIEWLGNTPPPHPPPPPPPPPRPPLPSQAHRDIKKTFSLLHKGGRPDSSFIIKCFASGSPRCKALHSKWFSLCQCQFPQFCRLCDAEQRCTELE